MDEAPFSLVSDALPAHLDVVGFEGHEQIGRLYDLKIDVLVFDADDLDLDAVLGAEARFTVVAQKGDQRQFHGVIASAELVDARPDSTVYRFVLAPKLWLLTLPVHSRVFVDKTVPQILEWILGQNHLAAHDYELRLCGSYPVRPHVSQYRESDFDFLSRLMERDGIYYFFEASDGGEKLILADDKGAHPALDPATLPYRPHSSDPTSYAIEAVTQRRNRVPEKVALRDYDKLKPLLALSGEASVSEKGAGVVALYGENFTTPKEGARLARLRAEELAAGQETFTGAGRAPLRAGYTFSLEGHPRAAFQHALLATVVRHRGAREGLRDGKGDARDHYRCEFVAIPASVQFRSARATPIPRIDSVLNAVVDGQADSEYAQLDEHGRYRVRLKYDENDAHGRTASMWVRMAQPHGGDTEGFHFPLRKGTEVLLVFLGGDPDRPIICGVVPNLAKPSPVTSANHTKNVLQTGAKNRLEIEDAKGGEYVKWTTPFANTVFRMGAPDSQSGGIHFGTDADWHAIVAGDSTTAVTGNILRTAGGRLDEDITGPTYQHYASPRHEVTDGFMHQEMKGGFQQDETGFYEQNIKKGGYKQTIDGFVEKSWKSGAKQTVTGDYEQNVSDNVTQKIGGYLRQNVGHHEMMTNGHLKDLIVGQHEKTTVALTSETFVGGRDSNVIGMETKINQSAQLVINAMVATVSAVKMDTCDTAINHTQISIKKVETEVPTSSITLKKVAAYLHSGDFTVFK